MSRQQTELSRNPPLVSVIVPVFNGELYLPEALESIVAQHYEPTEILVIDDGSTDGTSSVAKQYQDFFQYVYQENKGPSSARNRGLTLAKGELIAFLDADDRWPGDKLALQVPQLLNAPEKDVVTGRVEFFGQMDKGELDQHSKGSHDVRANVYLGCGVFRRKVFQEVGMFDEELRYSEDHDWFLRARERGIGIKILDHVTLYHRVHEQNMTNKKEAFGYELPRVLRNSLERRRSLHQARTLSLPKMSTFCEDALKPGLSEGTKK